MAEARRAAFQLAEVSRRSTADRELFQINLLFIIVLFILYLVSYMLSTDLVHHLLIAKSPILSIQVPQFLVF